MLDIIQNSPYRLLGIYSNSPTKERVANHNRLKAFLKVGKDVSFPLDLPTLLPATTRNADNVADADAKLTLPNEQLRYAQFWFMKATSFDDIAMNHLIAGNIDGAISIWEKKDNASSLQNRIVCALILNNYSSVFACAEKLYSKHTTEFVTAVLGEHNTVNVDNLEYGFLDELCNAIGAKDILPYLNNNSWKQYVDSKVIKPLVDLLQSAIDTAKASRGKGITARYNVGVKLKNDTKDALSQLKTLLSASDLQYQMIADKLGLEILQCGIDYYNGSEAADAALKAMKLQSYALSVVVGKMAKDRCKENVDILQNIIDNLPPTEVFPEDKAIKKALQEFCQRPDLICHAVTLLNNAKPHLQSIKAKLGATSGYYLKMSTQVVGNALHNIIEEVNAAQKDQTIEIDGKQIPLSLLLDRDTKIAQIKKALRAAWEATKIIDAFDMEADFKNNRYYPNRSTLKDLCNQLGISTSIYVPTRTSTSSNSPKTQPPTTKSQKNNTTTSRSEDSGCIIGLICTIVGAALGGLIAGGGGLIFGALIGFGLFSKFTD